MVLGGIKRLFFRALTFSFIMSLWEYVVKPYFFPDGIHDLGLFLLVYTLVFIIGYILSRGVVK